MENELYQLLTENLADSRFGKVIHDAISLLGESPIKGQHGPNGAGQSSKQVAKLHAFRKRSGYYKEDAVGGLDETIEALNEKDVPVRLAILEGDQAYVALWLSDDRLPLGVMVLRQR